MNLAIDEIRVLESGEECDASALGVAEQGDRLIERSEPITEHGDRGRNIDGIDPGPSVAWEVGGVELDRPTLERRELGAGQGEAMQRRRRVTGAEDPNVEARL